MLFCTFCSTENKQLTTQKCIKFSLGCQNCPSKDLSVLKVIISIKMAVSTLSKAFLGASARKVAFNPSAFFARPQLSLAVTSNQRAGSTMAVPKSSQMPAAQ